MRRRLHCGASVSFIAAAQEDVSPARKSGQFQAHAVLTQREAGGNLSEVLDRLAAVMRERFRVKREVRVRSAHGRITAWVLTLLPPSVAFLMLITSPSQIKILTTDPLGIRLIIAGVLLQLTGTLIVRKLVNVEY